MMKLQSLLAATVLSAGVNAQGPCLICPTGLTVAPTFEIVFPGADGSAGGSTTCQDIISIAELYTSGTEDCDGLTTEVESFCCPGEEPVPVTITNEVVSELPSRPPVPVPGGAAVTTMPVAAVTIISNGTTTTAPIVAIQPDVTPFPTSLPAPTVPTTPFPSTAPTTPAPVSPTISPGPTLLSTEGSTPTVGDLVTIAPTINGTREINVPLPTAPVTEEPAPSTPAPSANTVSLIPETTSMPTLKPTIPKIVVPTTPPPTQNITSHTFAKSAKLFKGDDEDSSSSAKAAKTKAAKLLKSPGAKSTKSSKNGKSSKATDDMETISRPSTKSSKGTKSSKNGKGSKAALEGQTLGANYLSRTADHSFNGAEGGLVCCRQSLGIIMSVVVVASMAMFGI